MPKKLSDDFMKTNEEYTKLKGGRSDEQTPRETPGQQGPAGSGYAKPDYADWTTDELRQLAAELAVAGANEMQRDELVRVLQSKDATIHRS